MRDRNLSELNGNPADVFLEFGYPEVRWLAVAFVLLVSMFLISSIFSLGRSDRSSKLVGVGALATWGFFFLAIVRGGQGLWESYQIAERLLLEQRDGIELARAYGYYVRSTYWILDTGGGLFILGMACYIGTHVLRYFVRSGQSNEVPPMTPIGEQGVGGNRS